MKQQLGCCGMCKIFVVLWSARRELQENKFFHRTSIISETRLVRCPRPPPPPPPPPYCKLCNAQLCNDPFVTVQLKQQILTRVPSLVPCTSVNPVLPITVQCCYNSVNFLTNIHKRHFIAYPLGRVLGCLLWIKHLIYDLPEFITYSISYCSTRLY